MEIFCDGVLTSVEEDLLEKCLLKTKEDGQLSEEEIIAIIKKYLIGDFVKATRNPTFNPKTEEGVSIPDVINLLLDHKKTNDIIIKMTAPVVRHMIKDVITSDSKECQKRVDKATNRVAVEWFAHSDFKDKMESLISEGITEMKKIGKREIKKSIMKNTNSSGKEDSEIESSAVRDEFFSEVDNVFGKKFKRRSFDYEFDDEVSVATAIFNQVYTSYVDKVEKINLQEKLNPAITELFTKFDIDSKGKEVVTLVTERGEDHPLIRILLEEFEPRWGRVTEIIKGDDTLKEKWSFLLSFLGAATLLIGVYI